MPIPHYDDRNANSKRDTNVGTLTTLVLTYVKFVFPYYISICFMYIKNINTGYRVSSPWIQILVRLLSITNNETLILNVFLNGIMASSQKQENVLVKGQV